MKLLKEQGYTLLELVTVITIIGVLFVIAAPNFSEIIARNKIINTTNELVALTQYARTSAYVQNKPMNLCPLSTSSPVKCASGAGAFATIKQIGILSLSDNKLIRAIDIPSGVTIKNMSTTNAGKKIIFMPDGSSGLSAIGATAITVSSYNDDGSVNLTDPEAIDSNSLAVNSTLMWKIKSNSLKSVCRKISVSFIGQSEVTALEGETECE